MCAVHTERTLTPGPGKESATEREPHTPDRDEWVSFHAGPPAAYPRSPPTAPHDLPGYNVVTHDLWLPNGGLASGALQNPRTMGGFHSSTTTIWIFRLFSFLVPDVGVGYFFSFVCVSVTSLRFSLLAVFALTILLFLFRSRYNDTFLKYSSKFR